MENKPLLPPSFLKSNIEEEEEEEKEEEEEEEEDDDDDYDVEEEDDHELKVLKWWEQITLRCIVLSALLGFFFCVIVLKIFLTVGIIPSLNVAAGLLAFFAMKSWTKILTGLGFSSSPFTRQENTIIQTCVVACYGIAFSGGFGNYLLAMDENSYNLVGTSEAGNREQDIKNPSLGWIFAFMFSISFVGIFSLVPLRKILLIDNKLTYPSGTATAFLINSFHTQKGAAIAGKQVKCLGKYFILSFFWNLFKWFFSGIGNSCGFDNFPLFGLRAYENTFYYDFNTTYVGAGMLCSHIVNFSLLLGGILSWGLLWPFINSKAGDWYPEGLGSTSFKGLLGYKVFISVAIILGDGFYNIIKIVIITMKSLYVRHEGRDEVRQVALSEGRERSKEAKLRAVFMGGGVPFAVAASGYVALVAVATGTIPALFPALKWYHVLLCYVAGPWLGFCNAYGAGLTNWNTAVTYGKLGLFVLSAMVGSSDGGVIAGLAACGITISIVSVAADLMQDLRTGYLTETPPSSMLASQLIGAALGCIIAPLAFWMLWSAFDVGDPEGQYPAPLALLYREMAIVAAEGLSSLPLNCLQLCCGFFSFALLLDALRDMAPPSVSRFIPVPIALAIPFYLGAYFSFDFFLGSAIVFLWQRHSRASADRYASAVASGLICGDGVWAIPSAALSLFSVTPPICMSFASSS